MPPHCDALDGPVVKAARRALEAGDAALALPYVHKEGEQEVRRAFDRVLPLRSDGAPVRELADLYFFETVVRVHRAGEGAPYTGLKPAGLDVGPVIPAAERAIETDSAHGLEKLLTDIVKAQLRRRFEHLRHLRAHAGHGVEGDRAYVEAMLGLQVWSHKLSLCAQADPHEGEHDHHG